LQINFDKDSDEIDLIEDQAEENWIEVCERYDDDVHRIRSISGPSPFTAVYTCYDEDNNPSYFLVEEDSKLDKMRHKIFLDKLGRSE